MALSLPSETFKSLAASSTECAPCIGDWTICREVGSGGFSRVYEVSHKGTGKVAAAKVFDKKSGAKIPAMKREAALISSIAHPNVIGFNHFNEFTKVTAKNGATSYETVLFTDLAPKGDLLTLLEQCAPFPEEVSRSYFHQIVSAIEHLHSKNICHRDIKPENFLLDDNMSLKLTDFGYSKNFESGSSFTCVDRAGTDNYMAPEVYAGQAYDGKQLDLFSAGIILFLMGTGHCPFSHATNKDNWYNLIMRGDYKYFWKSHQRLTYKASNHTLSFDYMDLISRLISPKSSERLTLQEIKAHPWFKGQVVQQDKLKNLNYKP